VTFFESSIGIHFVVYSFWTQLERSIVINGKESEYFPFQFVVPLLEINTISEEGAFEYGLCTLYEIIFMNKRDIDTHMPQTGLDISDIKC